MIFIYALSTYLFLVVIILMAIKPKHTCYFMHPVRRFNYSRNRYQYFLQCHCSKCVEVDEEDEVVQTIGLNNFQNLTTLENESTRRAN